MRHDPRHWAKVCLERSPIGDLNVVSVVAREHSDDATHELIPGPEHWLRLSRKGQELAIHHSSDGETWRFARFARMDLPPVTSVGVHAQAPFGDGVEARFKDVVLLDGGVADYRSGE